MKDKFMRDLLALTREYDHRGLSYKETLLALSQTMVYLIANQYEVKNATS